MTIERRVNWEPIKKDYGGEDIQSFYSIMFLNQIVAIMYARTRALSLPISKNLDNLVAQQDETTKRLKEKGAYFYPQGGSVFADYKIMREQAYKKIGFEMGENDPDAAVILGAEELKKRFNTSMSTEKALEVANQFVKSWDWN